MLSFLMLSSRDGEGDVWYTYCVGEECKHPWYE